MCAAEVLHDSWCNGFVGQTGLLEVTSSVDAFQEQLQRGLGSRSQSLESVTCLYQQGAEPVRIDDLRAAHGQTLSNIQLHQPTANVVDRKQVHGPWSVKTRGQMLETMGVRPRSERGQYRRPEITPSEVIDVSHPIQRLSCVLPYANGRVDGVELYEKSQRRRHCLSGHPNRPAQHHANRSSLPRFG